MKFLRQHSRGCLDKKRLAVNADHQSAGASKPMLLWRRSDTVLRVMPARDKACLLPGVAFFIMSKTSARAHQPILQAIQLSPEMAQILTRIRKEWCGDQTQLQIVSEMLIALAIQNWDKIRPGLQRDSDYILHEDLPNCWGMWHARINAAQEKGFKP